jgi:cytochrome P450
MTAALAAASRTLADLPRPPGALPGLGHLLKLDPKALHTVLEGWARDCGPCYTFGMGPKTVLVTADPDHAQAALRDRPDGFRRLGAIEPVFRDMGIDAVFSIEGERWRPQRRLVMQTLAPQHIAACFGPMQTITQRLYRRWDRIARDGGQTDVAQDLVRYAVDVTSTLSFGQDVNTLEADGDPIQRHLGVVFPMINARINFPFPYWRYVKLRRDRELDTSLAAIRQFVNGLIERARAEMASPGWSQPTHLLQALLQARDEPGSGISDDDVQANVVILLLAGEDTTAHALAWTFHQLAQQPALQDRLAADAARVLGPADVAPGRSAIEALDLCEGMVFESLRLRPVVPIIFLETVRERMVGDIRVPGGTPVFLLTRPAALDPAHFTAPAELHPERWHGDGGSGNTRDVRSFLQFGAGPRVCPGRHLATVEMRMVLSMALKAFRFHTVGDPAATREQFGFTMMPDRLPMRLERR